MGYFLDHMIATVRTFRERISGCQTAVLTIQADRADYAELVAKRRCTPHTTGRRTDLWLIIHVLTYVVVIGQLKCLLLALVTR